MDPEKDYYLWENDRAYVNPTASSGEQMDFISTLRDSVGRDNVQIASQTEALRTDVPSSLGGLTGSEGYFAQRYQTAPIEAQVNTLKATAQAKALNDLLTNYKNQAANRYNQAYRNYQKRNSSVGGVSDENANASNGLTLNVNGGSESEKTKVSTTDWRAQLDSLNSEPNGQLYFYTYKVPYKDPVKIYVNNLQRTDDLNLVLKDLGQGHNGQIKSLNGVRYIYVDDGKFAPSWYRVGASSVPVGY